MFFLQICTWKFGHLFTFDFYCICSPIEFWSTIQRFICFGMNLMTQTESKSYFPTVGLIGVAPSYLHSGHFWGFLWLISMSNISCYEFLNNFETFRFPRIVTRSLNLFSLLDFDGCFYKQHQTANSFYFFSNWQVKIYKPFYFVFFLIIMIQLAHKVLLDHIK